MAILVNKRIVLSHFSVWSPLRTMLMVTFFKGNPANFRFIFLHFWMRRIDYEKAKKNYNFEVFRISGHVAFSA